MRPVSSRSRFFAAIAASMAFVTTFAVSARAVMQDPPPPPTRTYTVIAMETPSDKYQIGQTYQVPVGPDGPEDYVELSPGVWAKLTPTYEGRDD